MPAIGNSRVTMAERAAGDAFVVARLRRAGAVILGKTKCCTGSPPAARPSTCRGRLRANRGTSRIQAQQRRAELSRALDAAMAEVDVAICVSSLELPAPIDDDAIDRTDDRQARMPFNLSGNPAIAVPVGFSSTGLPLGMQAGGRHFDEATVYGVASALEEARLWAQHWAPSGLRRHAIPEGVA